MTRVLDELRTMALSTQFHHASSDDASFTIFSLFLQVMSIYPQTRFGDMGRLFVRLSTKVSSEHHRREKDTLDAEQGLCCCC